jgi:hypothetical protein
MCADIIPAEVASNGQLHLRTFQFSRDNEIVTGNEYIPNVIHLMTAITSLEGIVMTKVHPASRRKYAWTQIGRTYFFSMLHMIWLHLRHKFRATTDTELDALHLFDRFSHLDSCVLPDSIANEIMRITTPVYNSRTQVTSFPCVRSGLLLSELFTSSATGNRTRRVLITHEYKRIPSVRISQNMIWLLCKRWSIPTDRSTTYYIVCALLNGSFEPTDFIINDGALNEDQLFALLCNNPALALPYGCTPQVYALSFDEVDVDNIARPLNTKDCEPIFDDSPPAWLEPQLGPICFDACRATSGVFIAFDSGSTSFEQLEIPSATVNINSLQDHISQFGNVPRPSPLSFDANFWLDAVLTRGNGSA